MIAAPQRANISHIPEVTMLTLALVGTSGQLRLALRRESAPTRET